MGGSGIRRDAVDVLVGQQAAGKGLKHDAAHVLPCQGSQQLVFNIAGKHIVARLADQEGDPPGLHDFGRLLCTVRRVVRDSDIQGSAAVHDGLQGAHGLLQRGLRIRAVVVEDVDIVQMHPLQALIRARNQVLSAAEVAVGAGPHVIARLGRDDELIPIGAPVAVHEDAEVGLGLSVRRTVVVGQIKMGDSRVKGRAQDLLLHAQGRDVPEIVPQAEGEPRQHQAAVSAPSVKIASFIARLTRGIGFI